MKYREKDKVRVKSLKWYNKNKSKVGNINYSDSVFFDANMSKFCGSIVTIKGIDIGSGAYEVEENEYYWIDDMFEGPIEEGIYDEEFVNTINTEYNVCLDKPNKICRIFISDKDYQDEVELCLGNDYEVVVEGGRTFIKKKELKYSTIYKQLKF